MRVRRHPHRDAAAATTASIDRFATLQAFVRYSVRGGAVIAERPVVAEARFGQRSVARVVFALDGGLRRWNAVFDYAERPDCIFRAKIDRVAREISLANGVRLRPGDRIVDLHFRNEHFPRMDRSGATIEWARRTAKLMDLSFRQLFEFLDARAEFDDIVAVRAVMPLRSLGHVGRFEHLAARFGFELVPDMEPRGPTAWMRRLGQNAIGLLLVFAGNPRAARLDILWRRGATAFLSRPALNERYRECSLHLSGNGP